MNKAHRLISGKLIYAGKTKKRSSLDTRGRKSVSARTSGSENKPIKEGSTITVELNEKGTVVDLWKAL